MAEAKQRQGHGETCRCFRLDRVGARTDQACLFD